MDDCIQLVHVYVRVVVHFMQPRGILNDRAANLQRYSKGYTARVSPQRSWLPEVNPPWTFHRIALVAQHGYHVVDFGARLLTDRVIPPNLLSHSAALQVTTGHTDPTDHWIVVLTSSPIQLCSWRLVSRSRSTVGSMLSRCQAKLLIHSQSQHPHTHHPA